MSKCRCMNCGGFFNKNSDWYYVSLNKIQRACSEECYNEHTESARQKARERERQKPEKQRMVSHNKARKAARPKGIPMHLRSHIKIRDNFQCVVCRAPGHQVHHVQFRSQQGKDEMSNLVLLCNACHLQGAHGEESKLYRMWFRAYIWIRYMEDRIPEWGEVMVADLSEDP